MHSGSVTATFHTRRFHNGGCVLWATSHRFCTRMAVSGRSCDLPTLVIYLFFRLLGLSIKDYKVEGGDDYEWHSKSSFQV